MQKEAYFFGVPCVTLRTETEWVERVEAGWNVVVGCNPNSIIQAANRVEPNNRPSSFFGDGRAAECIVSWLSGIWTEQQTKDGK